MNGQSSERWEQEVAAWAASLAYPPTPDLAARSRQRAPRRMPDRRLALAGLALLLILAIALGVPQVRAAIADFLQLGAVRVWLVAPTATPLPPTPRSSATPTLTPVPTATPVASLLNLAGETTLEKARQRLDFGLPAYPADLGLPDRVYVQDMGGPLVVLVWMDRGEPARIRLSLHVLGPGTFAGKFEPPVVQETIVNGAAAVWTAGPYLLEIGTSAGSSFMLRRLVQGHVLVWQHGDNTYRLETSLPLAEAVRIAETVP